MQPSLLRHEQGVWVYQDEGANLSISELLDAERAKRWRGLVGIEGVIDVDSMLAIVTILLGW